MIRTYIQYGICCNFHLLSVRSQKKMYFLSCQFQWGSRAYYFCFKNVNFQQIFFWKSPFSLNNTFLYKLHFDHLKTATGMIRSLQLQMHKMISALLTLDQLEQFDSLIPLSFSICCTSLFMEKFWENTLSNWAVAPKDKYKHTSCWSI